MTSQILLHIDTLTNKLVGGGGLFGNNRLADGADAAALDVMAATAAAGEDFSASNFWGDVVDELHLNEKDNWEGTEDIEKIVEEEMKGRDDNGGSN